MKWTSNRGLGLYCMLHTDSSGIITQHNETKRLWKEMTVRWHFPWVATWPPIQLLSCRCQSASVCHAALSACMIHEASSFPLISRESVTVSDRHTHTYTWHKHVQTVVQASTPTEQSMLRDYLNVTWLLILCFYLFQWNSSLMFTGFPGTQNVAYIFYEKKKKCNLYSGK